MRWFLRLMLAALLAGGIAAPARATDVAAGEWYAFSRLNPGAGPTSSCVALIGVPCTATITDAGAPPWTFTAPATGAVLNVTDIGLPVDQFEVFDFGVSLGLTSVPSPGAGCLTDPIACLADPGMSHGVFLLAAGAHAITIDAVLNPTGGTTGAFQVSVVPEPMSLGLFGLSLGALLGARYRRCSRTPATQATSV